MAAALRILSRRARSEQELRQALERKGFIPEQIEPVLARCRELGYLDDAAFALERARGLMRSGRGTGPRVIATLQRQGVDKAQAETALEAARGDYPEADLLRCLLERRFPDFEMQTAGEAERRKLINFFLRRGFALSLILDTLNRREADDRP